MTGFENFYSSIDATGPAVVHIGPASQMGNDIRLKICGRRLLVTVVGEPVCERLFEHFREGLAAKVIHPNMRALVDLTRFVGVIDWTVLARLRALAPWGEDSDHPSRVAYLLRDSGAAMMVKAASALFPLSQHRAFTHRDEAIAWLEATRPAA
ncbi:MAG TPA: STAS/SEC14 domain-containing protein [Rhizomicrobium sp.]|nr:STAS/SEC14 domain-containing protein [Rhizomicrobium sp.]